MRLAGESDEFFVVDSDSQGFDVKSEVVNRTVLEKAFFLRRRRGGTIQDGGSGRGDAGSSEAEGVGAGERRREV